MRGVESWFDAKNEQVFDQLASSYGQNMDFLGHNGKFLWVEFVTVFTFFDQSTPLKWEMVGDCGQKECSPCHWAHIELLGAKIPRFDKMAPGYDQNMDFLGKIGPQFWLESANCNHVWSVPEG